MVAVVCGSRFVLDEEGVSSIEYALLCSLIAVFCLLAVKAVGTNTSDLYMAVCNAVAAATDQPPC